MNYNNEYNNKIMYTSKELMTRILSDLMQDPYLAQFKLRKSDCFFYIKEGDMRKSISLQHWSDILASHIRPTYGVKFGILMKWFERFSFMTLKDQRYNSEIFFQEIDGITRGRRGNIYDFDKDGENYIETITTLREDLVNASTFIFNKYNTLENVFQSEVQPLLDVIRELGPRDIGADWIFTDLRLCQLISPKDYPKLKEILMKHFNFMYQRGEPNIELLVNKVGSVDKILAYLDYLAETKKYS